jgi:hypothetical protein
VTSICPSNVPSCAFPPNIFPGAFHPQIYPKFIRTSACPLIHPPVQPLTQHLSIYASTCLPNVLSLLPLGMYPTSIQLSSPDSVSTNLHSSIYPPIVLPVSHYTQHSAVYPFSS